MNVRGEEIVKVTQLKEKGGRHMGELIIGLLFILLSLFLAGLFIYSLLLPIFAVRPDTVGKWIIFIIFYIFLVSATAGATAICFYIGRFQLTIKPKWKFTLYSNEIVAHTLKSDFKKMKEEIIPVQRISRCVIVRREQRKRLWINQRSFFRYHFYLGAHIYYEVNGEEKLISFEDPNDLAKLDQAVRFLQDDRNIPMHFTHAKDDDYVPIDLHQLIQLYPPEPFTLPHRLEQLDRKNYNISIYAELKRRKKDDSQTVTLENKQNEKEV